MRRLLCGMAFALAAGSAAADQQRPVRFLLGTGLTFGGDRLVTILYTDGETENLRAGELYAINAGLEFRLADNVSAQATIGYHADSSSYTSEGRVRFRRYPLELIGHFHVDDRWRVCGGLRFVNNIELTGKGVALANVQVDFKNAVGALVEVEYRAARNIGIKVRGVAEEYEAKGAFTGTADANHLGLYVNFYF